MERILQILFFMTFMSSILFLLNYVVLGRLFHYFALERAWLWAIIGAISFPLTFYFQRTLNNVLTYYLNKIAAVWFGFIFVSLCIILLFEFIQAAHGAPIPHAKWIVLFLCVGISLFGVVNAKFIDTKHFTIESEKITEPLRVVHLTDQHVHGSGADEKFDRIISKVNELEPDILAITGDLVDEPGLPDKDAFYAVMDVPYEVFFVHGNHEFYSGIQVVENLLPDNVHILRSKAKVVGDIQVSGVDDPTGRKRLSTELPKITTNKKKFQLLLYHQPSEVDAAVKAGYELMLVGHTHGGQIFPFNFLVGSQYKYVKGLFSLDQLQLYVSPGTGTWGPPMRIGSRNTIAVFDLVPKS